MKNTLGGNILGGIGAVTMSVSTFQDNELLTGISILAVSRYITCLELSKCMLIEPLLSYSKVLAVLKRANSNIKSIEDLIIKESITFTNFDSRFHEKLLLSVNSILLFENIGLLKTNAGGIEFTGHSFEFSTPSLGEKAKARIAASRKLAEILMKGEASDLFLSLRVEL